MHPSAFIAALATVAKIWKQMESPSADEWMKMWHIYAMESYSAIERTEICHLVAKTDGSGGHYTK